MPVSGVANGFPGYRLSNGLHGLLIYGGGDACAALILEEFNLARLLGMAALGGSLYALEVPNWFHYIDRRAPVGKDWPTAIKRTAFALLYFNPLWIARHLFFVAWFSGQTQLIDWSLLSTGWWSFLANIPLAVAANHWIQNHVPAARRFLASSLFSAAMAIYYALSGAWFGDF